MLGAVSHQCGSDQIPVPAHQLIDDHRELGDIGSVTRIGVADHRYPAVAGFALHADRLDQVVVRLVAAAFPRKYAAIYG